MASNRLNNRLLFKRLSVYYFLNMEDIVMFEKICIAVITGIILEIFKIILKELIEYIKIKFTR